MNGIYPINTYLDFDTSWSDEDLRDAAAYSSNLVNKNIETGETE